MEHGENRPESLVSQLLNIEHHIANLTPEQVQQLYDRCLEASVLSTQESALLIQEQRRLAAKRTTIDFALETLSAKLGL